MFEFGICTLRFRFGGGGGRAVMVTGDRREEPSLRLERGELISPTIPLRGLFLAFPNEDASRTLPAVLVFLDDERVDTVII